MTITYVKNRYGPADYDWNTYYLLGNTIPINGKLFYTANIITYNNETDCFILCMRDKVIILKAQHLPIDKQ